VDVLFVPENPAKREENDNAWENYPKIYALLKGCVHGGIPERLSGSPADFLIRAERCNFSAGVLSV